MVRLIDSLIKLTEAYFLYFINALVTILNSENATSREKTCTICFENLFQAHLELE